MVMQSSSASIPPKPNAGTPPGRSPGRNPPDAVLADEEADEEADPPVFTVVGVTGVATPGSKPARPSISAVMHVLV